MDQREQDTTTTSLRSKLQLYVLNSLKSLQNTVNDSNSSSIRNIYRLLTIVDFIVCSRSPSSQQGLGLDEKRNKKEEILNEFQLDFKEYSKASLRSEFMRSFYSTCLSQLLSNFNPNLYTNDNNNNKNEDNYKSSKDLFLNIMSNACFTDTFNVIYDMSLSLRLAFIILIYQLKRLINPKMPKFSSFLFLIFKSESTKRFLHIFNESIC